MPTPPLSSPNGHGHSDLLVPDAVGSFVPKTEDVVVSFLSFDTVPQDNVTSSAAHKTGAAASFDPKPGSSHSGPSVAVTQVDMDVLESVPNGDSSNAFMHTHTTSQQQIQLPSAGTDEMQGITPIREQSPGSVHSPPSNPLHAASSIPPAFSNVSTSSLASALDGPGLSLLNRSRSGSLVSPTATTGFVQGNSPPQTAQDSQFKFSPPAETSGTPRPDPVNAPHMLAVDDVLNSIIQMAASARQACCLGQGAEASSKIDEMKQKIVLVSELLSQTRIDSPTSQHSPRGHTGMSGGSAPSGSDTQGHKHSASVQRLNNNTTTPPGFIPNFPNPGVLSVPSGPSPLDQPVSMDVSTFTGSQGSPDSDNSRKRCASSLADDRMNKAIRLDAADGNPLQLGASPPKISLNLSPTQGQLLSASQAQPPLPSPVTGIPGNVQIPLSHATSTGSLSTSITPVPNLGAGATLSGSSASGGMSMSQPKQISSAPVTGMHPGIAHGQPPASFPLSLPSPTSLSLTENGMRDIKAQLDMELTSPISVQSEWPDMTGTTPTQSQLGSGFGTVHPQDLAGRPTITYTTPSFPLNHAPLPMQTGPVPIVPNPGLAPCSGSISQPNQQQPLYAAMSRNGSVTSLDPTQQQPSQPQQRPEFVPSQGGRARAHSQATVSAQRSPSSSSSEDDGDSDCEDSYDNPRDQSSSVSKSSPPLRSRPGSPHRRQSAAGSVMTANEGQSTSAGVGSGNEIPPEYRAEVDRIFFEFLNQVCSNLDATDAKGELIHQTLMAKKMQRLDESPDFRPFKFRIQAFTNGFLEELARQSFGEDKIAMKKVRNYLWTQPYISRFNEDGKKAKSKGNHIWNIDAKKKSDGGWEFRPFRRKLAGAPPSVAYIGLRWSWTPRIWDPQASRANIQVQYCSPNLPSWLSWRDGQLQGVPPPDAQSCEVTVEARTMQDGKEELLKQTFVINVSPVPTGTDMSFGAVRPSLADLQNPRRVHSDSIVPGAAGLAGRSLQALSSQPNLTPQDAQMMQVLTSAAQRVAQEAQAHVIASTRPNEPPNRELQALAKQQHVLTVTAQALDQEVTVPPEAVPASSHALVAAAQQVVFQAARQVAAERTTVLSLTTGVPPSQQPPASATVTVNEVSVATQSAVAQAVDITGPLSSEVDVMMTASSLLQQQHQVQPQTILGAPVEPVTLAPNPLNAARPHSTGTIHPSFSVQQTAIPAYPAATAPLSFTSLAPNY